jgi:hypothetical protein
MNSPAATAETESAPASASQTAPFRQKPQSMTYSKAARHAISLANRGRQGTACLPTNYGN